MKQYQFKENSLDLIRLFAAMQVMVLHSFEFTMPEITDNWFFSLLELFPGVPIFFFISGYLISKSYEKSPNLSSYWKNRILRIYPALLLCVLVNIILVASTGYLEKVGASFFDVSLLFLAKGTILQFYNPEFMRGFGDGVLNGSLWTICVELQFYFIVPIFYKILIEKIKNVNVVLAILLIIFMILNRVLYALQPEYSEQIWWKLYRVSFAPWFYMFLFGVIVQRNFDFFIAIVQKVPLLIVFVVYFMYAIILHQFNVPFDNSIAPYLYFPLAVLVFYISYHFVSFSKNLIQGNDLSYGVYIWHMPFVNQLMYYRQGNEKIWEVTTVLVITTIVAWLSWRYLERNALTLKNYTLKRVK